MSKPAKTTSHILNSGSTALIACSVAVILSGCVVRVPPPPPPPPPPPRVYVPPAPPPPAAEPVIEEEAQASEAPPPLPDYEQPPCPDDGYLWTPGYWRWYGGGYVWVPGTWVQPPRVGVLWTPPYWGFVGSVYVFHAGYWGPHVGFYGGVNYGFGYGGVGFAGGHWAGGAFAYNTAVVNVNRTVIHNTYNVTVVNNVTVNKVSYNGGAGGVVAAPNAQERAATQESHVAPTPLQRQHLQEAVRNPSLSARANGGHPAIAATARPAAFHGPDVVGARGAAPMAAHGAQSGNQPHPGNPPPQGGQHAQAQAFNAARDNQGQYHRPGVSGQQPGSAQPGGHPARQGGHPPQQKPQGQPRKAPPKNNKDHEPK